MASSFETANTLIAAIKENGMPIGTVRLLEKCNIESAGAYARKILNALETAGILKKVKGSFRRDKSFRWDILIQEPTDIMIQSALKAINAGSRTPRAVKEGGGSSSLAARIEALERAAVSSGTMRIEVKVGANVVELGVGEVVPACFKKVTQLAAARKPIMLVGPAGCGKTHLGAMVAKALGLSFSAISCSAGMSEAHLLGRAIPNVADGSSVFQTTDFLEAYEGGGLFLLDEVDAADSNLLLVLNSALANGYLSVPARTDDPSAIKHKDFVLIASANTFGRGSDRLYVGRSQLDEATLDRFRIGTVEVDYDKTIETSLCPDQRLLGVLWQVRDLIRVNSLRRIMSTRFIKDAYEMASSAGWEIEEILATFFQGWNIDEARRCQPVIPPKASAVPAKTGDAAPSASNDEGGEDGWKLPMLNDTMRSTLQSYGVKIEGVSAKQTIYAERIVAKWMTDSAMPANIARELKPIYEQAGNRIAQRIIRWFNMKYVPGKGDQQPAGE